VPDRVWICASRRADRLTAAADRVVRTGTKTMRRRAKPTKRGTWGSPYDCRDRHAVVFRPGCVARCLTYWTEKPYLWTARCPPAPCPGERELLRFRTRRRELLLTGVFVAGLLVASEPANAQPVQPSDDLAARVERLLASNDPTEVAWGAYTAAQYRVLSAVPLLTNALGQDFGGNSDVRHAAELAILDALVQLDASVPAETLRGSLSRWPVPTLILLNNATGDRDALLLQRLNATSGFEWQAIANFLLRSRPSGFAASLLRDLRLRINVYVTDEPQRGFGGAEGPNSESPTYVIAVRSGYPPTAEYQFSVARPGATILSIGPKTVYYTRHVRTSAPISSVTGWASSKPSDLDRIEYLNALVRQRVEMPPLAATKSVTVVWIDSESFRQQVLRHRTTVQELYRLAVSALISDGLLTKDESQRLTPNISIEIRDVRANKSESLPKIEGGGVAVRHRAGVGQKNS